MRRIASTTYISYTSADTIKQEPHNNCAVRDFDCSAIHYGNKQREGETSHHYLWQCLDLSRVSTQYPNDLKNKDSASP